MNWDRIEGNWKQFRGKALEQWGKLTDDELDVIAGKRDALSGRIQEVYGISQDEAERQIRRFEHSLPDDDRSMRTDKDSRNEARAPQR
ncbi:MAG: CsbD family protein [Steroidobacteraceae bacterium]